MCLLPATVNEVWWSWFQFPVIYGLYFCTCYIFMEVT